MRPKPFVGQKLFSLNVGNAARHRLQVLTPVEVKAVGRKYFKVGPVTEPGEVETGQWSWKECHLEDWSERSEYSANFVLYENEQEWLDEKEATQLFEQIRKNFDHGSSRSHSLKTLREITAILMTDKGPT